MPFKLSDSVSASDDEVDALADKPGDGMEPREQPSLTGELKTAPSWQVNYRGWKSMKVHYI